MVRDFQMTMNSPAVGCVCTALPQNISHAVDIGLSQLPHMQA